MTVLRDQQHESAPDGGTEAWEAVLAAVEADVCRTEAIFHPAASASTTALTPAETMLPLPEPPPLPSLGQMPPVPPELLERITELKSRIDELRSELETCLAAARQQSDAFVMRPPVRSLATETAHFVDRRA
jgi:hypothetical protein